MKTENTSVHSAKLPDRKEVMPRTPKNQVSKKNIDLETNVKKTELTKKDGNSSKLNSTVNKVIVKNKLNFLFNKF